MIQHSDISVVLQGAVDRDLTPAAIRSIRRVLPGAEIVLSTWRGADVSSLDVDILLQNEDPGAELLDDVYQVKNNVNRQILSSKSGISKATKPFVLKIRSDISLKNDNFVREFGRFPARNQKLKILEDRLVVCNLYCANPRRVPFLFHISDWVAFGRKKDVLNMWDIPLGCEPGMSRYFYGKPRPPLDPIPTWLFQYIPEQYIWTEFLKKNGVSLDFEYFCDYSDDMLLVSELSIVNNVDLMNYEDYGIEFAKFCPYKWDYYCQYSRFDWLCLYKKYCDGSVDLSKTPREFKQLKGLVRYYSAMREAFYDAKKNLRRGNVFQAFKLAWRGAMLGLRFSIKAISRYNERFKQCV